MKRFVIPVLLTAALIFGTVPVCAAVYEDDRYITFEEYSAAIEEEYSKYGIEGGVYEPEGEFICTYEMLQNDLEIVKEFCEDYVERQQIPVIHAAETEFDIGPMAMRDTVTMTDLYTYSGGSTPILPASCTIETTADIIVDYQGGYICYAETPSLEIIRAIGFADWIEYIDHSTTIDQDKFKVTMNIACKVKQEVTLGVVTSWSKIDVNYSAVFKNVPC